MKIRHMIVSILAMLVMALAGTAMADESDFVIENGVLVEYTGSDANVVIPDGVTAIGDEAFKYNDSIEGITIPSSVTTIGEKAFYDCSSLSSITIPSSVTSIGGYAFKYCDSLSSITIPSSVISIGDHAFAYCDSLSSITIPSSVTSIGEDAFKYCTSLSSVKLENSVIGHGMFWGCDGLSSITIPSSVTSIGDGAFYNCDSLSSITIPSSVTSIGADAFKDCSYLSSITIPSSVTSIGYHAFKYCDSLSKVVINGEVSLGSSAFAECPALKSVFTRGFSYGGYPFDLDNVVFIAYDSAHGAMIGGTLYNFSGSKIITPSDYTKARVYSAEASAKSTEKGGEVTITVIGNAAIDTLEERIPESAQLISESSETKGVLKIWEFTYKLNGAPGFYDFTYVNADKPSLPTATAQVLVSNGYQVISAEFDKDEYKANTYAAATVYTDTGATSLNMYSGSKLIATWKKADFAEEEDGMLKWEVGYHFSGAGERTMTFKASDGKNYCPGVQAKVTILTDKKFDVISASFANGYAAKGTAATATVKTDADAKYLVMYNGSSKVTTWKAADASKLSGDTRIWTVKYTFSGAGNRTLTFKASYDNKLFGVGKDAKLVVTSGSEYDVTSAAFNTDTGVKGKEVTATVKTGLDAKYLAMYNGSTKLKSWAAADYSVISGTTRVWTISYSFTGTGSKSMTFKASKDNKTFGTAKKATVLITSGNSINVSSAKFASDYAAKGTAVSVTVKTGADAKYLAMYNGSSKLKTWKAADYSKISGTTRVWTVSYTFTGTGSKSMTFKASKDNKTFGTEKKASVLVTSGSSINVTSAKFGVTYATKGTAVTATVKTGADAQYLVMYNGSSKVKTWKAADASKLSGNDRVWTISYSFTGTGSKNMTFKASKDNSTFGTGKNATVLITSGSSIDVSSAKFAEASVVKGTAVTITVKTGADAQYLAMYTEKGAKAKTWNAADCSKISGTSRVWTISYKFSGAGERTMTFKASKDNSTFGVGKTANIAITAE